LQSAIEVEQGSVNVRIPQNYIPALPFIDDTPKEEEIPVEPQQQKIPRRERKDRLKEFLEKTDKNEQESDEPFDMQLEDNSYHDARRLMRVMSTDLEEMISYIKMCRKPPITDDWEENKQRRRQIEKYISDGIYNDADTVVDYIEALQWYGRVDTDMFGTSNYLLNETIKGYKQIYDELLQTKDKNKGNEALRLLNKLILCAMRPLVEDKMTSAPIIFEEAIEATRVTV
jgi:hypothetical protein